MLILIKHSTQEVRYKKRLTIQDQLLQELMLIPIHPKEMIWTHQFRYQNQIPSKLFLNMPVIVMVELTTLLTIWTIKWLQVIIKRLKITLVIMNRIFIIIMLGIDYIKERKYKRIENWITQISKVKPVLEATKLPSTIIKNFTKGWNKF